MARESADQPAFELNFEGSDDIFEKSLIKILEVKEFIGWRL